MPIADPAARAKAPSAPASARQVALGTALALFIGLVGVGGAWHEPWLDEAQAWLIARDSTPWAIVSHIVRYEGTPGLWHLILWSLQRLGWPYGGLWLISAGLACGGVWLILYRSPFPVWLRIGLSFSYFFGYQYAVVARSYALELLLIPLLAVLFEGRLRRPLIYGGLLGLLAQVNAHSFIFAAVLASEFAWTVIYGGAPAPSLLVGEGGARPRSGWEDEGSRRPPLRRSDFGSGAGLNRRRDGRRYPSSSQASLGPLLLPQGERDKIANRLRRGQAAVQRPGITRNGLAGMTIYLALGLLAAWQAWPPADPKFDTGGGVSLDTARPIALLVEALVDRANIFASPAPGLHIYAGGLCVTLLILIPAGFLCWSAGRIWLAAALFAGLAAFTAVVYANYWHSGIFLLALLFCLWISWDAAPRLRRDRRVWLTGALAVLVAYQAAYCAAAWRQDIIAPYSASRAAAQAIARLEAETPNATIAAVGAKTFSVQALLPHNPFANFQAGPHGEAFYVWSSQTGAPTYTTLRSWRAVMAQRPGGQPYDWLLLSTDDRRHQFALTPYQAAASAAGYCLDQSFAGGLIWKARVVEPDGMVLFRRCATPPYSAAWSRSRAALASAARTGSASAGD